jgi:uncharacterized protein (UPF0303 family)
MATENTEPSIADVLAALLEEEQRVTLDHFDYATARRLGEWVIDRGTRDGHGVQVNVVVGEHLVYAAALEGTSHDNDLWLARKIRTVQHYGHSSFYTKHVFLSRNRDFATQSLLDPQLYTASGGGFPIRVGGSIVGVVAVTGWNEPGEHALAVQAVEAIRDQRANAA